MGCSKGFALSTLCLGLLAFGPASALECTAPATWIERTICGSNELTRLDRTIGESEAALVAEADPRFRSAIAADSAAWRATRDTCRKEEYPQACVEHRHYARIDALNHLAGLVIGPRRFGNPLRGCWQNAETEDQAQACLDAKLADSLAGLAVAASGVREALAVRDQGPDAAGDSLALFDSAETAFAAHEKAACLAEAAALGEGRGRELGGTACRITLVRDHAVDILRFMPGLAAPWTTGIRPAREAIDACIARAGPGTVVGLARVEGRLRIRIAESSGGRQDCEVDGATVQALAPVAAGVSTPDEGLARYAPGAAPIEPPPCGLAEPVTDAAGAVIGYLIVNGC